MKDQTHSETDHDWPTIAEQEAYWASKQIPTYWQNKDDAQTRYWLQTATKEQLTRLICCQNCTEIDNESYGLGR